jgi:hypothetical protein
LRCVIAKASSDKNTLTQSRKDKKAQGEYQGAHLRSAATKREEEKNYNGLRGLSGLAGRGRNPALKILSIRLIRCKQHLRLCAFAALR